MAGILFEKRELQDVENMNFYPLNIFYSKFWTFHIL